MLQNMIGANKSEIMETKKWAATRSGKRPRVIYGYKETGSNSKLVGCNGLEKLIHSEDWMHSSVSNNYPEILSLDRTNLYNELSYENSGSWHMLNFIAASHPKKALRSVTLGLAYKMYRDRVLRILSYEQEKAQLT